MVVSRAKLSKLLTAAFIATVGVSLVLSGCKRARVRQTSMAPGTAGPIHDLTAIRIGDEISLNWTTPRKGVRKLLVEGSVSTRVCRFEEASKECTEARHSLLLAPGAAGNFAEELPASMAAGPPRVAYYGIEITDRDGKPTGIANRVPVLAGAPPPAVEDLTAEKTQNGVTIRWHPEPPSTAGGETRIRLLRTEGPDLAATQAMRDGLVPIPVRPEVDLFAVDGSAGAVDSGVHTGNVFQYRAQRIFRIVADGQTLEIDGQISPEVEVNVAGEARQ